MCTRRRLALLACTLLLAACGQPLPPDKADYAGLWQAPTMRLQIGADGQVNYAHHKQGAQTTINAPIKAFQGNNFEVGIGPFTTVFVVTAPPHQYDGQWRMTVDGVELQRAP